MNKKNISEIHTLSFMQQSLLMHHLQTEKDQGFLQVQCRLRGKINHQLFKEAFYKTFQKHKALRTTIHWENLSHPIQVVHKEFEIPWIELDWTSKKDNALKSLIDAYLDKDKSKGMDLRKVPLSRIHLIKLNDGDYLMIWTCHHILVDGWSSINVIEDTLSNYTALLKGFKVNDRRIPSFFDYLNWVKKQDTDDIILFWEKELSGNFKSKIFQNVAKKSKEALRIQSLQEEYDTEVSSKLKALVQSQSISLNVFFQGIWALILSKILNSDDVVFGSVFSGRAGIDMQELEHSVGMFMNVLPTRFKIDKKDDFFNSLRENQSRLSKLNNYEWSNLNQISQIKFNISDIDSLFIFENFNILDTQNHEISISDYRSGITTTFPLTFVFIPESQIKIISIYDSNRFQRSLVNSIMDSFERMLYLIVSGANLTIEKLRQEISIDQSVLEIINSEFRPNSSGLYQNESTIEIAETSLESGILQIWESVLEVPNIGPDDDFFELGGTSLQAVILFNKIKAKFGVNLSITKLLTFPTVRKLAREIEGMNPPPLSNCIIPLKSGNSMESIYCLHSVSGDILHYKDFIECIKSDRPVFGIQPYDNDNEFIFSEDLGALAEIYADEIEKNQPVGSCSILSYCYTCTLSIEIARKLIQRGNEVDAIVMIDPAPFGLEVKNLSLQMRIKILLRWIWLGDLNHIFTSMKLYINERILHRYFPSIFQSNNIIMKTDDGNEFERALKEITKNYKIEKPQFKVVYIRSNDIRSMAKSIKGYTAWKEFLNENMIVHHVDGDHHLILEKPFINTVAQIMENEIKKARFSDN